MRRIAIIGNAGGGKSTFAMRLGAKLDIPVHHIDLLQWRPDWVRTPVEDFDREHEAWLAEPAWIIDGWGRPEALGRRFDRADTLIFVDFPIALHYWWATKRQVQALIAPRPDWPPPGCKAWPITADLYRLMWTIHTATRPKLLARVLSHRGRARVEWVRSPRQLTALLRAA